MTAVNEFLTPRSIAVNAISETHAKVVLEPLERGFGHTLGTALRREQAEAREQRRVRRGAHAAAQAAAQGAATTAPAGGLTFGAIAAPLAIGIGAYFLLNALFD